MPQGSSLNLTIVTSEVLPHKALPCQTSPLQPSHSKLGPLPGKMSATWQSGPIICYQLDGTGWNLAGGGSPPERSRVVFKFNLGVGDRLDLPSRGPLVL